MIKLIEEFGADENKSLLVALPPHLLDEIKVDNKGSKVEFLAGGNSFDSIESLINELSQS